MNPDAIKQSIQAVVDGLTPLAQKMQIPLEGVFHWAVKHNYAVAVGNLLEAAIMAALLYGCYRFMRWGMERDKDDYGNRIETSGIEVWAVLISLLAVILLFIMVYDMEEGIQRLMSPEWYAAQDLINLIKK